MKNYLIPILFLISTTLYSLDEYIGLTSTEIYSVFGAPNYIYSLRGEREAEDDVIFFYESRLYIYFNQNRVWQLRVDKQYSHDVLTVRIGDTEDVVTEILGEPFKEYEDSLLYKRPDAGYPIYLRIYFVNKKVDDIYLFRGDY